MSPVEGEKLLLSQRQLTLASLNEVHREEGQGRDEIKNKLTKNTVNLV
jgi:hypothetical protein